MVGAGLDSCRDRIGGQLLLWSPFSSAFLLVLRFPLDQFVFRHAQYLPHRIVEPLKFGLAGNIWCWKWLHVLGLPFDRTFICWPQRQQIYRVGFIIERVIEIHPLPLAGYPHRKKPNVFSYPSAAPWVATQEPFGTLCEFVSPHRVESELSEVLLKARVSYDLAVSIQA